MAYTRAKQKNTRKTNSSSKNYSASERRLYNQIVGAELQKSGVENKITTSRQKEIVKQAKKKAKEISKKTKK